MGLRHSSIQQEPARGFYMDPRLFMTLPGLEMMRSYRQGIGLPPPVHYLYGLFPGETEAGRSTFTMPASRWLLPSQGIISGATLALLADGPLGSAVMTALPPATPYTTAEMSLSFIRPVVADGGTLTGTATLVHAGRSVGISEVSITNEAGEVMAVGSTRCMVMDPVPVPPGLADEVASSPPRQVVPEWPTPHPFERPAEGELLDQDTFDAMSGLEMLRGFATGELPAPPISRLLGVFPEEASEGESTWTLPATEWMCSPVQGRLYGGVTAYHAGNAIDGAVWTTLPKATAFAPLDLKVYFLRPVAPDGRDLVARGRVTHRGRSLAIGTSEVFDGDGRKVAMATGSAMILPGRVASVSRRPPGSA